MPKLQGIVMKTKKNVTTIYTEQGDFLQIPTPKTEFAIGETITIDLGRKTFRSSIRSPLWQIISAAAVLLMVLSLTLFNVFSAPQAAAASVELNYGQSIVLQVDKDAKVITVQNPRGHFISPVAKELKGMDIYQAVNHVLSDAQANHLMAENNNLVLASILPLTSGSTNIVTADKLRSSMRADMVKDNLFGDLMVADVDQEIQRKAAQLGLNINNYLIYSKLVQTNKSADPSTFSTENISNILSKANVSVENLYPQESCQIMPPNSTNPQNMPKEKNVDGNPSGQPNGSNSMNPMPQQPRNSTMPSSGSMFNSDNSPSTQPKSSIPNNPSMGHESGMNSMENMR